MFDSIKRGFGFVGQALDMARKDGDLLKPSLYGLVVGAFASLIGSIPLILIAVLLGVAIALGLAATGTLLAAISAFSSYIITAYHTCMFLWARNAERAAAQGQSVQSAAAPVAAVLGLKPA